MMKGPQGRRGQQKARQERAKEKGEGQPSPHWLSTLTDYQLRGFILTGAGAPDRAPFAQELARRMTGARGTAHAPDKETTQ